MEKPNLALTKDTGLYKVNNLADGDTIFIGLMHSGLDIKAKPSVYRAYEAHLFYWIDSMNY